MFERFRAASSASQIQIAISAVLALTILLAGLWFAFFHVSYVPLFTGLRQADAATIVAELDRRKLPYRLADGGRTILVPDAAADATRLDVAAGDTPLKGTVGFELFNKSDIGLTDLAQKINYQRALQGELERTIMSLDGVDTARVHLSLGEDRVFRDDQIPPTASVTIRMQKDEPVSPALADGVRRLVAAAVSRLDVANVVVVDRQGRVIGAAPQAAPADDDAGVPALQERHAVEDYYAARIRQALMQAYPLHQAMVTVSLLAGGGVSADLSAWKPDTRDFPLRIVLAGFDGIDHPLQEEIRHRVLATVTAAAAQNDEVVFSAPVPSSPNTGAAPPAAVRQVQPWSPSVENDDTGTVEAVGIALAFVALLVVFLLVIRRARGDGRLNERQKADFAGRLRAALEREAGNAPSRS